VPPRDCLDLASPKVDFNLAYSAPRTQDHGFRLARPDRQTNSNLNNPPELRLQMDTNVKMFHSGYWGPVTATLDWCEVRCSFPRSPYHISDFFRARQIISSRTMSQRCPTRSPISSSSLFLYTVHVCTRKSLYPLAISWGLLFVLYVHH
jgi:hypothetical protein